MLFFAFACSSSNKKSKEERLVEQLANIRSGDKIELEAGVYNLTSPIKIIGVKDVKISGKGMGKTILQYNQNKKPNSLILLDSADVTLCKFSIRCSDQSGVICRKTKDVTFKDLEISWVNNTQPLGQFEGISAFSNNKFVLEHCTVTGFPGAGMSIESCTEFAIRKNRLEKNLLGIKIFNSSYGEIYDNQCTKNNLGLLLENIPEESWTNGKNIRVFNNNISENEIMFNPGFYEPKWSLALGVGILIETYTYIDVYNNKIKNNAFLNLGIKSSSLTDDAHRPKDFDLYYSSISVHDNDFEKSRGEYSSGENFIQIISKQFGKNVPDIVLDGTVDPATIDQYGNIGERFRICIRRNINASVGVLKIEKPFYSESDTLFDCDMKRPLRAAFPHESNF